MVELSEQEQIELADELDYPEMPRPEEKSDMVSFFKRIIGLKDSRKVGNLNERELYAVRRFLGLVVYCQKIGYDEVAQFLSDKSEIILGTSLSRDATLLKASISKQTFQTTKIGVGSKKEWKQQPQQQV